MKKSFVLFFVVFVLLGLFFISASGTKVQDIEYSHVKVQKSDVKSSGSAIVKRDPDFGNIPLYFIPNKGQVDGKARFYAKTSRYTLWMTKEGLVFDSVQSSGAIDVNEYTRNNHSKFKIQNSKLIKRDVSRLVFLDANKNPEMVPIKMTPHKVSYFKGKDPSKWQTGIHTSKAVLYKGIYKNIDLKVYGIEKQVEYDWIVKPGADPGKISFEYKNVKAAAIDNEGNLVVETIFGKLMHKKPVSYQLIEGKRVRMESAFKETGKNTYGFKVKKYNRDYELIIDPMVCPIYSTYLGGSGNDHGDGIAVDSDGYAYVTGYTGSTDFPTENAYQETLGGNGDVFVTKLSPTDGCPVYSTYLGGSDSENTPDIAVDSNGCAYVTGYTTSTDFPTANPYQSILKGISDAFVTKLSPGGDNLVYSTYLGGDSNDYGRGIIVDSEGSAYLTGETTSSNFPVENAFQETYGGSTDAFVTKFTPGGNDLVYSTYLGGSGVEYGEGITVDSHGSAYITGRTGSDENFPTKDPYQDTYGGGTGGDVFVTKLSPTGKYLLYSTYLGGSDGEVGWSIALDNHENAYVTGRTSSSNFPTKNAYQETHGGGFFDAFITKLSTAGDDLVYSTFLGGNNYDYGCGIAVDHPGSAYMTGYTSSSNFPVVNAYQETYGGGCDAFVTKLTPSGNVLSYSTYLGGSGSENGRDIAVDSNRNAYVTGYTNSTDFPTHNACQNSLAGLKDAFVSRFCFCESDPVLVVNKTLLNFAKNNRGDTTDSQNFLIRNIGEGTLNWTVSDNATWLECNPTSGTNFGVVTVSVDASGLSPDTYKGTITVSDDNAINSPQTILVTLRVYGPKGPHPLTARPFGFFETPGEGATVRGSVPFTGWALDDIEVVSVKLCLGNCKDSTYIGEATFVEGARPDVAQVYPEYPYCNRAGWGYLMLTNALDDGTYVVHAEAGDREGKWVTLGTKTITIDNANAVKPFGTIDTPAPGGTASGSNYRVLGWALTPPPNKIPSDGVHLYVDGVDLGEATYDIFRQDVYDLFPGYENRDGALAYYDLNTIDCDNGMHTVHFVATDDGANTDGIGSRYFNIWNLGTINSVSQASSQKFYSMPEITKIPVDYSGPVNMKKGFKPNIEPETVYPDENGNITIEIRELERIEVRLFQVGSREETRLAPLLSAPLLRCSGYQVTGDRLTPLPIGSMLDTDKGIFYWSPGPGFIGEYLFVFVEKDANGAMNKKLIKVKILPKFGK